MLHGDKSRCIARARFILILDDWLALLQHHGGCASGIHQQLASYDLEKSGVFMSSKISVPLVGAISFVVLQSTFSAVVRAEVTPPAAPRATPMQTGLSSLFAFGAASAADETVQALQGGGHDPHQNGFTVQNVELTLSGTVDPYWDAQANIIMMIDAAGETVLELEEAFALSRGLPGGLQIKAGQFFTEFGRQNAQHPHTWAFVDQPLMLTRAFGPDGLRSQGARLSWLAPAPWFSELYIGTQNANGETAVSFLSVPDEDVGGHVLQERRGRKASDLLYSLRWLNGFDAGDRASVNLGLSALRGPNASGNETITSIYGADAYLKWTPVQNQRGFPFLAWQTELIERRYEAGDTDAADREVLTDTGGYSQVLWGFRPGRVAGLRFEHADGNGDNATDALRDARKRVAVNMTWYPTEYSKLRVQINRDDAEHLNKKVNALWLQMEYNLGSHAAHTF